MSSYNAGILQPGVIAGIAIAACLLFVALIAIAIYCIVKQRKKNIDAEKADSKEPPAYKTESSRVMYHPKKDRYANSAESSDDSHNSSISSADGKHNIVSMNPDPKVKQGRGRKGVVNSAYASSDDGGAHDRSRDSTGSDMSAGITNGSFDSGASDNTGGRRYNKHQDSSSLSRTDGRRGSARSRSRKRKDSASDDKNGRSRDRNRPSRSSSGHRSSRRDSERRKRSHGPHGGSQRRSRSRSPHSQSSNTSVFDNKGHNTMYSVSSMAKRNRESSNSSTSSRDSGDDRTVSHDPSGRRRRDRGHENHAMTADQDMYGSQV